MFDNSYKDGIERAAKALEAELLLPQNFDLVLSMISFGLTDEGSKSSFMFGFTEGFHKPMSFDDYSRFYHQFMPQLEDLVPYDSLAVSKHYDQYINSLQESRDASGLTAKQAARFSAIIDKLDDGWSGFMYGMICRLAQRALLDRYAGMN